VDDSGNRTAAGHCARPARLNLRTGAGVYFLLDEIPGFFEASRLGERRTDKD
jgi:hypothetical protein